ncbi:MAG: choice-of-anchor D domain-containing protein, partial [bacterium]
PTIALTGTGAAPIVSVASTTMDLGLNLTGTSVPGTFVVTNSGDDSLHISSIVISQPTQKFFLTSSGGPIAVVAGGSTQLTYNYTSASEGSDNGTLTINSDDIANPSKQITLLARSGTPKLTVNTKDTVDFGNVRVGGTGSASISVMNSGSYDLGISFGSFTPVVFNATNVFPTIPPLQKVDENLQFSPVKEGPVTGMFVIQSTDSHNSFDTVYMKGVGVISALVIPSLIDFHQLNISKTVDTTIMLHNFGTASAKIFSYRLIDSSKGFLILDTVAHSIAPKDSVKIKLRFAPTQEIPYSATLNITTDDASPLVKILLHGTGIDSKLSTDINSIDFTTVDSDSSRSKKFILTNNGSAVATIQSVKITGATEFSSTTVNTPFTLKAGATKEISITFSPLAAGTFDGTYVITATEGSPITVSLHGKGHVNTVVGSVKNISDEFGISLQISPNPVSKASEISISSAKPTNVTFGLFDANGKLVLTIAGGFIESEVRYFPLSVSGLPSGEYFLTAQVNGVAVASSKILIVH